MQILPYKTIIRWLQFLLLFSPRLQNLETTSKNSQFVNVVYTRRTVWRQKKTLTLPSTSRRKRSKNASKRAQILLLFPFQRWCQLHVSKSKTRSNTSLWSASPRHLTAVMVFQLYTVFFCCQQMKGICRIANTESVMAERSSDQVWGVMDWLSLWVRFLILL